MGVAVGNKTQYFWLQIRCWISHAINTTFYIVCDNFVQNVGIPEESLDLFCESNQRHAVGYN